MPAGARWNLLDKVDHRPWPVPARPWTMTMCWRDLLFMHWPILPRLVAALVPPGLEVDTFDGSAWIGVVPFRMTDIGLRRASHLPWVSSFAELNVRTYVRRGGKSGVWFFSLDAASRLAVEAARAWFHLPYFRASIRFDEHADGFIAYESTRTDRRGNPSSFRARYRPTADPCAATIGTLDHWLTERYCFFAVDSRGRLSRSDVHHHPWPLQRAEAVVEINSMAQASSVSLPPTPPLLHFARKLDVVGWTPERVSAYR
jgi:uncharacterized protein YqjF (DUF2071 family)